MKKKALKRMCAAMFAVTIVLTSVHASMAETGGAAVQGSGGTAELQTVSGGLKATPTAAAQQETPKTGDNTAVNVWLLMLFLSGALLATLLHRRGGAQ